MIQIYSDSRTAIATMNHQGSHKNQNLYLIYSIIASIIQQKILILIISHIPRVQNILQTSCQDIHHCFQQNCRYHNKSSVISIPFFPSLSIMICPPMQWKKPKTSLFHIINSNSRNSTGCIHS